MNWNELRWALKFVFFSCRNIRTKKISSYSDETLSVFPNHLALECCVPHLLRYWFEAWKSCFKPLFRLLLNMLNICEVSFINAHFGRHLFRISPSSPLTVLMIIRWVMCSIRTAFNSDYVFLTDNLFRHPRKADYILVQVSQFGGSAPSWYSIPNIVTESPLTRVFALGVISHYLFGYLSLLWSACYFPCRTMYLSIYSTAPPYFFWNFIDK